jgi:hypothetical protein
MAAGFRPSSLLLLCPLLLFSLRSANRKQTLGAVGALALTMLAWFIPMIGGCAAVNALVFVYAPVYCSYGEVRRFERELQNIIGVLPQIASPGDTMIVGFDSRFLGYRHAGYYLPTT